MVLRTRSPLAIRKGKTTGVEKSVLVVEDEFLIAFSLATGLQAYGWHVIGPAGTVSEALDLLERRRPSAASLDVMLFETPVTPVATRLRALNVPFVLATAYSTPELLGRSTLAGVVNVGKPTDLARLASALDQVLGT
jgi:two-component system, response regulator PdtaR